MEQLYLDGNFLTSLDSSLLQSQNKLRMLELQDNRLTSVSIEFLKPLLSLRTFNLSGNPLLCTCALWDVWLWWNAHFLNPLATCQLPEANLRVSIREQLQNLTCNPEKAATVHPTVSPTTLQGEHTCDVKKLAVGCLVLLIIIFAMMIGFFVYTRFYRAKHCGQQMLLPLEAERN